MKRKMLLIVITVLTLVATGCKGGGGDYSSPCKSTGTAYIGLAQQGSTSYIYNTTGVADPLGLCQTNHAVITNVKNNSGHDITLAHNRSVFIILENGASIDDFNNLLVEGDWSAQVSGESTTWPSQITIEVTWAKP